jgi:hypothetical protein
MLLLEHLSGSRIGLGTQSHFLLRDVNKPDDGAVLE